jgi:hypothetical protein
MYGKRNNDARWRNHCSSRKAISITYSECVCVYILDLVIRHANRMGRIMLYRHLWPVWLHHIVNPLAPELFFLILAHPVYKM